MAALMDRSMVHLPLPTRKYRGKAQGRHESQVLGGPDSKPPIPAAEYVRMSVDKQEYSIANQQQAIREYAASRGMAVVRTYSDAGRSGLTIGARPSLGQLLRDVIGGNADYSVILVYDVSRWGRFQDTDESAHYEYLCRRAHVHVEYCAEPFGSERSPLNDLLKSLKRSMAAEYSRELSERLCRAYFRFASLGYFVGGSAGYGLRRLLLDRAGQPKRILERGEFKAIQGEHLTLTPGPAGEVRTVVRMFRMAAEKQLTPREIAGALNEEGRFNSSGKPWQRNDVYRILKNERYMGTYVYNRRTQRLGAPSTLNDHAAWIRTPNAFKPIVSETLFVTARCAVQNRKPNRYSDEQLRESMRRLLKKHGYLSYRLLKENSVGPPLHVLQHRFGSMNAALSEIGYTRPRGALDPVAWAKTCAVHRFAKAIAAEVAGELRERGAIVKHDRNVEVITVGDRVAIGVSPARCVRTATRKSIYWALTTERNTPCDYTLVVRMDRHNVGALDYWLLPQHTIRRSWMSLREDGNLNQFARSRLTSPKRVAIAIMKLTRTSQKGRRAGC
jgi:DNA invertase Pin-like site-specific DNA recombinase